MSVDYCLDVAARADGCEIAEVLTRLVGTVDRPSQDRIEFELLGVRSVGFRPDQHCREMTREAFGFHPTHTLVFRLDKFDLRNDGLANMLRVTVALMRDVAADAVLLQNCERPLILRRDGRMILQDDSWWADRLERVARDIGGPYGFNAMPVI